MAGVKKTVEARERRERITALHAAGRSAVETAADLGISLGAVRKALRHLGLSPAPRAVTDPVIAAPAEGMIGCRLLSALRAHGDWAPTPALVRALGDRDRVCVREALERLYRDGLVDKVVTKKPGEPRTRAHWRALRVPGPERPSVGDRVVIRTADHPHLDGAAAVVVALESWGAHLHTDATASKRYRASWDEMETACR